MTWLADLGRELPVGAPLATVVAEGEAVPETAETTTPEAPAPATEPEPEPAHADAAATAPASPPPAAPPAADGALRVSPAARQLAAEKGVDLSPLKGSGPGGAIVLSERGGCDGRETREEDLPHGRRCARPSPPR